MLLSDLLHIVGTKNLLSSFILIIATADLRHLSYIFCKAAVNGKLKIVCIIPLLLSSV